MNFLLFMLRELSDREIRDVIMLTSQFEKRLNSVAEELRKVAQANRIADRTALLSIAAQALMLSAVMYPGTRESFLEAADKALEDAKLMEPPKPLAGARG